MRPRVTVADERLAARSPWSRRTQNACTRKAPTTSSGAENGDSTASITDATTSICVQMISVARLVMFKDTIMGYYGLALHMPVCATNAGFS